MNSRLEPLLALLRRYPYSAVCAVLAVASGVGAWLLIGYNEELEVARAGRAKEGEAMLTTLVGASTQRQELAAVREAARRIEENLVVESNLAENAFYFYKFEEQTKIRLPDLHPLSSPATETSALYRRVPYTLRASGTFEQVASFIFAIESGPRLARITGFSVARRDPSGAEISLDLSLDLLGKK